MNKNIEIEINIIDNNSSSAELIVTAVEEVFKGIIRGTFIFIGISSIILFIASSSN